MQKQKQKSDFGQEQSEDELTLKPLTFAPPDIHETMRIVMTESEKEQGRNARYAICCCGSPGCRIGPMVEKEVRV